MDREKMLNKFNKIVERGQKILQEEDVEMVSVTYCPICDDVEIETYKPHCDPEIEEIEELTCWGESHSPLLHQSFCEYHKESNDIEMILKYENVVTDDE